MTPPAPHPPSLWVLSEPLVLASASAARASMLRAAGLAPEIVPAAIDERGLELGLADAGQPVEVLAQALADAKALAVSRRLPGRLVLGADQTLSLDGEVLHKPTDADAARVQLTALAGRSHRLASAFALARDGVTVAHGEDVALMIMRPLSDASLSRYLEVAGPAVLSSVGAYQLEGLGAHLFERVEGDYFTVLGLPLLKVLAALRLCGALEEA